MATTMAGEIKIPGPVSAPDPYTFEGRLQLVVNDQGGSVNQVAKDLGVNPATFHTWVNGTTVPGKKGLSQIDLIERIATQYGYDRVWLAGGPAWVEIVYGPEAVTVEYPGRSRIRGIWN